METAIAVLVVIGLSALLLWGAKALSDRAEARYPLPTAAVTTLVAIPLLGASLAWMSQSVGLSLDQSTDVFATLAQLIATLLIAFAIEASAFKTRVTTRHELRELAVITGGLLGGAVIGLGAAIWGLVHPSPGLLFLGTAVAAIGTLVGILVALPVSRILRQDVPAAE